MEIGRRYCCVLYLLSMHGLEKPPDLPRPKDKRLESIVQATGCPKPSLPWGLHCSPLWESINILEKGKAKSVMGKIGGRDEGGDL